MTEKFFNHIQSLPDLVVYFILGISAFVENLVPPIPGDTITALGALLVGVGKLTFFGVYVSTTLGSLLGFLTLFRIGGYLGRRFFIKQDYRFFKAKDIQRAEAWFGKYGYYLIAANRFLPGIRSAISITGGIMRLNSARVTLLALLSCAVWNLLWILLGYSLGHNWEIVETQLFAIRAKYNTALLVLFGVFILLLLIRRKVRKRDGSGNRQDEG